MKIAYITSGAAGMYCGSCMHDNTLASALIAKGHDALLIPTYTPPRTDEDDVSLRRVFFGGINVFLQQKSAFFRRTPWFLDRLFDGRWLLKLAGRFAVKTEAHDLGQLAVSMLRGEHGNQKKEIDKLMRWFETDIRPDLIHLSNVLLSGMVKPLRDRLKVPVLASLQGDDVFLEALPMDYKAQALDLIRENCRHIDGFVATSRYYADFMSGYLEIPRGRIEVIYPGLNLKGHGGMKPISSDHPFTIGYFARICSEKGLHLLVEAFRLLRAGPGASLARLKISGWLGENQYPFLSENLKRLQQWGYGPDVEYVNSPDHESKVRFLQSLDVLSVPTVYREPKGLYVLEALANGVPVVQPRHGSFPELIEATGGGILVEPENPADLARGLRELMDDPGLRQKLGQHGKRAVEGRFNASAMAEATLATYRKYLP